MQAIGGVRGELVGERRTNRVANLMQHTDALMKLYKSVHRRTANRQRRTGPGERCTAAANHYWQTANEEPANGEQTAANGPGERGTAAANQYWRTANEGAANAAGERRTATSRRRTGLANGVRRRAEL